MNFARHCHGALSHAAVWCNNERSPKSDGNGNNSHARIRRRLGGHLGGQHTPHAFSFIATTCLPPPPSCASSPGLINPELSRSSYALCTEPPKCSPHSFLPPSSRPSPSVASKPMTSPSRHPSSPRYAPFTPNFCAVSQPPAVRACSRNLVWWCCPVQLPHCSQ